jgi:hypothetical protein
MKIPFFGYSFVKTTYVKSCLLKGSSFFRNQTITFLINSKTLLQTREEEEKKKKKKKKKKKNNNFSARKLKLVAKLQNHVDILNYQKGTFLRNSGRRTCLIYYLVKYAVFNFP